MNFPGSQPLKRLTRARIPKIPLKRKFLVLSRPQGAIAVKRLITRWLALPRRRSAAPASLHVAAFSIERWSKGTARPCASVAWHSPVHIWVRGTVSAEDVERARGAEAGQASGAAANDPGDNPDAEEVICTVFPRSASAVRRWPALRRSRTTRATCRSAPPCFLSKPMNSRGNRRKLA